MRTSELRTLAETQLSQLFSARMNSCCHLIVSGNVEGLAFPLLPCFPVRRFTCSLNLSEHFAVLGRQYPIHLMNGQDLSVPHVSGYAPTQPVLAPLDVTTHLTVKVCTVYVRFERIGGTHEKCHGTIRLGRHKREKRQARRRELSKASKGGILIGRCDTTPPQSMATALHFHWVYCLLSGYPHGQFSIDRRERKHEPATQTTLAVVHAHNPVTQPGREAGGWAK